MSNIYELISDINDAALEYEKHFGSPPLEHILQSYDLDEQADEIRKRIKNNDKFIDTDSIY